MPDLLLIFGLSVTAGAPAQNSLSTARSREYSRLVASFNYPYCDFVDQGETVLPGRLLLYCVLLLILPTTLIYAALPTIGEKAPDFQLSTVDGKAVHSSDLTPSGPIALVVLPGLSGLSV